MNTNETLLSNHNGLTECFTSQQLARTLVWLAKEKPDEELAESVTSGLDKLHDYADAFAAPTGIIDLWNVLQDIHYNEQELSL